MSEHPILFMPEMVQAYYAGRKWQTRRIIKTQPPASYSFRGYDSSALATIAVFGDGDYSEIRARCRYGKPGDSLYVKETYSWVTLAENEVGPTSKRKPDGYPVQMLYRADALAEGWDIPAKWCPSIFMPRWASRISFPALSIRAERVQSISKADCIAEGVEVVKNQWGTPWYKSVAGEWKDPINPYRELWDRINAKRGFSWDSNPWVWVIAFPKYEAAR